jgi:hypothetical protein
MKFNVPQGERYAGEVIDTWAMTVTPLTEPVVHDSWVDLPAMQFQAVILRRMN